MATAEVHPDAGPVDEDLVLLLREVFVGDGYTVPAAAETSFAPPALQARGLRWRAMVGGALAGTVFLVAPESTHRQIAVAGELEIQLLAVRAPHRRAGVAEALMRAALVEARARGARRVVLSTQPTMQAAHALYRKVGFSPAPSRDWTRSDGKGFLALEWVPA